MNAIVLPFVLAGTLLIGHGRPAEGFLAYGVAASLAIAAMPRVAPRLMRRVVGDASPAGSDRGSRATRSP